jgi:hypothetical protein
VQDHNGTRIAAPEVNQVIDQMLAREIDVLVIDPAVSFHSVPENDNSAMDMFAKEWGKIADRTKKRGLGRRGRLGMEFCELAKDLVRTPVRQQIKLSLP